MARWPGAAAVLGLFVSAASQPAQAIDYKGRWTLGLRFGDFVHADQQGGGFRVGGQAFGGGALNAVHVNDGVFPGFTLGRGIKTWSGKKAWQNSALTIELDVSRFRTSVGDETTFIDPNASTRVLVCRLVTGPDGDERFETVPLGKLTLTPVFVNGLFHWGPPKADFYAGVGIGAVFASLGEDSRYRQLAGDNDGRDDVTVKRAMAVDLKLGSDVRLTKSGRWYLFFEAQFYATQLLGGQPQLTWPGVNAFFGTQDCDSDDDGTNDTFGVQADFHQIDPGRIRIDGGMAGLGLRYRFGGKETAAAPGS